MSSALVRAIELSIYALLFHNFFLFSISLHISGHRIKEKKKKKKKKKKLICFPEQRASIALAK